jgi:hypothetical protein
MEGHERVARAPTPVGRRVDPPSLLRISLPDRPGGLALVTRCLAACGVDILNVDVVGHHDGRAIDDVLVVGGDLERGLRALEPEVAVLARRDRGDLPDPGLAMAAACASIIDASTLGAAHHALLQAAISLIFVDEAILLRDAGGGPLAPVAATVPGLPDIAPDEPSLARRSLRSQRPGVASGSDAWGPAAHRQAVPAHGVLALPVGTPPWLVLLLVRRDEVPFADVEIERVAALSRVAMRAFTALGERPPTSGVGPALRAAGAG